MLPYFVHTQWKYSYSGLRPVQTEFQIEQTSLALNIYDKNKCEAKPH